jgi:hypothetical protein
MLRALSQVAFIIDHNAEPLESELAVQVEYDMDEQGKSLMLICIIRSIYIFLPSDQAWLDAINVERKKDQLNAVSYETFEIIMDRLEKEWFDLVRLTLFTFFRSQCDDEYRPRISQNTTSLFHPKTLHARFVMTPKSKTPMLLCFVTDATWPSIRVSWKD